MSKIAVDIALLLPDTINEMCIAINCSDKARSFCDLSKADNYPHITLAMGVIDESVLEIIQDKFKQLATAASPLHLEITTVYSQENPDGNSSCGFKIRDNDELLKLHLAMMEALTPYVTNEATQEMYKLDPDEKFAEVSKHWVENYWKNHMGEGKYKPHISLKCGYAKQDDLPISFTVSRLAICHLGNFCSCRTILAETDLNM